MAKHYVIEQKIGGRWSEYDSDTDHHAALIRAKALAKHGGHVRVVLKDRRHNTIPPEHRHEAEEYDRKHRNAGIGYDDFNW